MALELAQFLNGEACEGNGPRLLGLGRLEAQLCFGLLQALDHAHCAAFQIDIPPAQRQYLAAPHPGGQGDEHRPIEAVVFDGIQKTGRLLGGERHHFLALDLGKMPREYVSGITGNHLLLDGATEGSFQDAVDMATALRRKPAGLAVPPPLSRPSRVGRRNMDGRELDDRQIAKLRSEEIRDDFAVSLVCLGADFLADSSKPRRQPFAHCYAAEINVLVSVERAEQAPQLLLGGPTITSHGGGGNATLAGGRIAAEAVAQLP